jgi:hypothetical protein
MEIQRTMGLMPMQKYRDRGDRHVGQCEGDQQISPPRQIQDPGEDHPQFLSQPDAGQTAAPPGGAAPSRLHISIRTRTRAFCPVVHKARKKRRKSYSAAASSESSSVGAHPVCAAHPGRKASRRVQLVSQQFGDRVQLLHVLRNDFHNDDDRNAKQHAPDAPQPTPEQQRDEHRR